MLNFENKQIVYFVNFKRCKFQTCTLRILVVPHCLSVNEPTHLHKYTPTGCLKEAPAGTEKQLIWL